ncbi:MAG TPA: SBBP repeat-containing protein [Cytophagaceae bacterium]|jgi:hypothetical protein
MKFHINIRYLLVLFLCTIATKTLAQWGSLDRNFGIDGIKDIDFGITSANISTHAMVQDQNGNIFVSGYAGDLAVAKTDSYGNYVKSFGTNGLREFQFLSIMNLLIILP